MVRLIRVFVSSPGDVAAERAALDEVVQRINQTDGDQMKMRLDVFKWETGVAPRIGPKAQDVVDGQMPSQYDIYLGIMKHRFGTPTGKYGSGTEKEFNDALERWGEVGSPWILFYFGKESIDPDRLDLEQYAKVKAFRKSIQDKGLYATYEGVRGSKEAFFDQVDIHLRKVVSQLHEIEFRRMEPQHVPDVSGAPAGQPVKKTVEAVVPSEYLQWLCDQCGDVEILGMEVKQGTCLLLDHVYTPLVTSAVSEKVRRSLEKSHVKMSAEWLKAPQLLLDLLNEQSLYVSGAPGSGKSTFCRWVTWLICKGAMPDMSISPPRESYREKYPEGLKGRLPVLIRLRDFWVHLLPPVGQSIGFGGLERAIEAWLVDQKVPGLTWGCLEAHLNQGSGMIMLDGVDEVPPLYRKEDHEWYPREVLLEVLPEAIKRWTGTGSRVLVTSRPYGLEPHHLQRLALMQAPIQTMDQELQALLAYRWFAILSSNLQEGIRTARSMIEHLRSQPGLEELSANPLLLTAMCIIYDEGKRLPADKYELYDRIVSTVLHKRYPPVKERVSEIRGRLGAIAWGMHTGDGLKEGREAPEATASEIEIDQLLQSYHKLDGATDTGLKNTVRVREELLSQSGLLLPVGGAKAQFYHLSFQEFLAAERMFLLLGQDQVQFTEHLLHRAESSNWRNTLSFVFGCLVSKFSPHKGVELLRRMVEWMQPRLPAVDPKRRLEGGAVWNQAMVLGECLEVLLGRKAAVPEDLRASFIRVTMRAIDQEIAVKERHALAVTMGRLGDPRIVVDLRVRSHPDGHPAYVKIPEGQYCYGDNNRPLSIQEPFWLTRYPVTNSQFALFIDDGGYRMREWWSQEGRHWRESAQVEEPLYWRQPDLSAPNQPVVGISFWEAEAFVRWAGGVLSTEEQWEAAARGPMGYEYTWGGKWEAGICNSNEAGLRNTSAVGIFLRSRSKPLGLDDIAGNVWEWCSSIETSRRVIRGGSWGFDGINCRGANRSWKGPGIRNNDLGFRVALVLPG
jgi:formylglycine-generating enzyme required for sulfatase activity